MGGDITSVANGEGTRSRGHAVWLVFAAVLIVGGVAASVVAAGAEGREAAERSQRSFGQSSRDIADALEQAIQREADLVVDAGGLLTDRDLSQTEFSRWAGEARVLERYPEMVGMGVLELVEESAVPAFAARRVADPIGPVGVDGGFEVVPAGSRPFYCLITAAVGHGSGEPLPPGLDFCADPAVRAWLLAARDSGAVAYRPYQDQGETWLAVETPIYRGGPVPTTVQARRASFRGWVGIQLDPTSMLAQALHDHRGLGVKMRYQAGALDVAFTAGTAAAGAQAASVDLGNGWTVETSGVVEPGGVTRGNALTLLIAGTAVSVLLGLLVFVLGTGRERARRQVVQRTSQLHHQALHDALTGLPNRALVMDRIDQMQARCRRHQTSGAALFLDLDDFKNVNDTLGHLAGDQLLVAVTGRMASTLRGVDTIGRMGGDEFVVLIDGTTLDVPAELVAQRLLDMMRQPFELDGAPMPITVNLSIGVASGDRDDAGDLLRDADVALYQAKAAGKNRYAIFDPEMHTSVSRRIDLEFDLRSALAGDQYRLVYQPIYRLDDLSVVGVEALLRWEHATRGLIPPDEFIPILERTGQIREVGRWVLREACRQMAEWHSRGDTLDISVNVSAGQLDHDSITDDILHALRASGLAASSLIIEITETALMRNVEATARRLRAIKSLGVRVAVDDFGTGYSSLAYLRQFPVDCLKIDRMFTSGVTTSPESKSLVGTLVQLGKDLGLTTLAEGVESAAEVDILRGADVDQAQGFLMARPLDPNTLERRHLAPHRTPEPTPVDPEPVHSA